ncbi:MAG TPA: hypothetical protein VEK15_27105, partial [Vicinamibacteria bacterium]|nr:hypothetical protein [Vicinamibacteria bacterium]
MGVPPCPSCLGPTLVQKSVPRNVVTLEHGSFIAYETVRVCAARCRNPSGALVTLRSESYSRRAPPGSIFGYDVEVFVGLERFVHHRQREEILAELAKKGVTPSSGEVSTLALRFLKHLAELHASRQPALREAIGRDGGYPLHFDATGEDGRGTLLVAYNGWREWVLGAWKLPTERADQITPCLLEVAERFGLPCAIMRDLGRAARNAAKAFVRKLKLKIPILGCHLHFLSDIGKDLLKAAHDKLRGRFREDKLRPGLRALVRDLGRKLGTDLPIFREEVLDWAADAASGHVLPEGRAGLATVRAIAQWVLDSARDGNHLGFPFERPYLDLYERARKARRAVDAFLRKPPAGKATCRSLKRLARLLGPVDTSTGISEIAKTVSARAELFDELRAVLRLHPKPPSGDDKPDLSIQEAVAELCDIRQALRTFKRSLHNRRPARGPAEDSREAIDLVLQHLKEHGKSLWGHAISLPKRVGGGIRLVARTNNLLESLFHRMKHGERRRSGRKVLTDDFEHLPADAALACNLTKPDYVEILCGSLEKLPDAFADLDIARRSQVLGSSPSERRAAEEDLQADFASLPRNDRRIVRAEILRQRIEAAARSRA